MKEKIIRMLGTVVERACTEKMRARETTYGLLFTYGYVARLSDDKPDRSSTIKFIRTNPKSPSAIADIFRFRHLMRSKRFLVFTPGDILEFDTFEAALTTLVLAGH